MRSLLVVLGLTWWTSAIAAEPVCHDPVGDGVGKICKSRKGDVITMSVFHNSDLRQSTQYHCEDFTMRTLDGPKAQWSAWRPVDDFGAKFIKSLCKQP